MKTFSKKLLSLLLVAVMLVAALPVFAFADDSAEPAPQETPTYAYTYTVTIKKGAEKSDSNPVLGTGTYATNDKVSSVDGTNAAAIAAGAGLSDKITGLDFKAGSVQGMNIYLRYADHVDAPAHTHDFNGTPVKKDDTYHTYTCTDSTCNGTMDEAHTWKFSAYNQSSDKDKMVCEKCGAEKEIAHEYVNGVCKNCGRAEVKKTTYSITLIDKTGSSTYEYGPKSYDYADISAVSDAQVLQDVFSRSISSSEVTGRTVSNNTNVTITVSKKADNKYNVQLWINNQKSTYVNDVTYNQTIESSKAGALKVLEAAYIVKTEADKAAYDKYTAWRVTSSGNTINVYAAEVIEVIIHRNGDDSQNVTIYPEVGKPYKDYLSTDMLDNTYVLGMYIKQAGANVYGSLIPLSNITNGSTVVGVNDREVKLSLNREPVTITFYKADNKTVLTTMSFYAGQEITNLPVYTVDGKTATWTYMGQPLRSHYTYTDTNIKAYPDFNSIHTVWLNIYVNGNVKTMSTQVELTNRLQDGTVVLNNEIKGLIADKLGNSKNTKLTYTGFFNADEWYTYAKNKNTSGTNPYDVSQRQGRLDLYIMVNNVNVKTADSSNPKTGDTAKLGVAAAVLAVAVVGFGAVTVVNKKKGVQ